MTINTKGIKMTNYLELRKINCNEFTERKGSLTYLSWTYALDILLQHDPMATWEFLEPLVYSDTYMVRTEVTALGKTLKMQLPVMDNRNNAIKSPDARKISDSQMRCLAKNIACFGVGLYIFAGSDLPSDAIDEEKEVIDVQPFIDQIMSALDLNILKKVYFAAVKTCGEQVELAKAKDLRKGELMAVQA